VLGLKKGRRVTKDGRNSKFKFSPNKTLAPLLHFSTLDYHMTYGKQKKQNKLDDTINYARANQWEISSGNGLAPAS